MLVRNIISSPGLTKISFERIKQEQIVLERSARLNLDPCTLCNAQVTRVMWVTDDHLQEDGSSG